MWQLCAARRCGAVQGGGEHPEGRAGSQSRREARGSDRIAQVSHTITLVRAGLTTCRLFTKASSSISIPRVKEICDRYRSLGFTRGAIELALQCASELDPQDKASDFVRDGEHPSDPRKALYEARMECYQCVVETLAVLDQNLDRATAQGDGEHLTTHMVL